MAAELPHIDRKDVTLLFHWHYYDGPLSGALEWQGTRYWFLAVFDDALGDYSGAYEVIALPDEQWERIDRAEALFREHVGTHNVYDPVTQRRNIGAVKPGSGHHRFYDHPDACQGWDPGGTVVATFRLWEASDGG